MATTTNDINKSKKVYKLKNMGKQKQEQRIKKMSF